MDTRSSLPNGWPAPADSQQEQTLALADQARRTVAVARCLLTSGRRVELAGLDRSVGVLCAKALDLPVREGRVLRTALQDLLAELDALGAALQDAEQ